MENGPAYVIGIKKIIPVSYKFSLLLVWVVFYLLGLLFALLSGMFSDYLDFWPNPIFISIIVWVSGVFCWALSEHSAILMELENQFKDVCQYKALVRDHLNRVYKDIDWVMSSFFIILILVIFLFFIKTGKISYYLQFAKILSYPLMFIYFEIIAIFVGFVAGSGVFLLVAFTVFIYRLGKLPINLDILPTDRTPKLGKLMRFSVSASSTWFVGVGLVSIITITSFTIPTLTVFILTFLFGLLTFLVPQYLLHLSIKNAKLEKMIEIKEMFMNEYENFKKGNQSNRILALSTLFSDVERIKEWPIETRYLGTELGSALFALLTFIQQIWSSIKIG